MMIFARQPSTDRRRPRAAAWGAGVLAALFVCLFPRLPEAQEVQKIAAIVNDDVISVYDLQQRVGLAVATSGVRVDEEIIRRIQEQVLRQLIDERLQLQEAERQSITVETAQVDEALDRVARSNGLTVAAIEQQLAGIGVDVSTLRQQLAAEIAWSILTNQRFAPQIRVSEEEVTQVLERIEQSSDEPQHRYSEIFLGVDSPDQDASVRAAADRLVQELRNGAPFPVIAQQFSQAASAATRGDVGYLEDSQLDSELGPVIRAMKPGDVAGPVRTLSGYYILALQDRRIVGSGDPLATEVNLRQAVLLLPADAPDELDAEARAAAEEIARRIPGCEAVGQLDGQPNIKVGDIGTRALRELSPNFREAVQSVPAGRAARPVRSKVGYHVVVVCDRFNEVMQLPTTDEIRDRLYRQQLDMMQRRFMRDLRRDATIEMR
ncbi:MAG: peptidylprolyl isomerase [Alphaproteobacteria bacterium]|nr:peptidylprolyl isomerase [Alphaproteobacteria bacterium]